MKKILSIIILCSIISGLNAEKYIKIKNDVKFPIIVTADGKAFNIQPRKSRKFVIDDFKIKEFKVAETKATDKKRTYTIAPVLIVKDKANNAYFKASKIFNKNKLPKGFSYKSYKTGLKPMGQRAVKPPHLDPVETVEILNVTIENDTPNKITVKQSVGFISDALNRITEILPCESKTFKADKTKLHPTISVSIINSTNRQDRVIIHRDAKDTTLKASEILENKKLPNGYNYERDEYERICYPN